MNEEKQAESNPQAHRPAHQPAQQTVQQTVQQQNGDPPKSLSQQEILILTRDVLLAFRGEYLRSGGNRKTQWDRIQSVVLVSAKTSRGVAEWLSSVRKQLKLGAPWVTSADLQCSLVEATTGDKYFLPTIERQHAYLMAMMRTEAVRRKEDFDADEAAKLEIKNNS